MSRGPTIRADEARRARCSRERVAGTTGGKTADGRGVEALGSVWSYLDLTPFGRQETWEDSPSGWPQSEPYAWWRRHDEY